MTFYETDMEIASLLEEGTRLLAESGVEDAATDARLLLGHCLGKSRTELYLSGRERVGPADMARFSEYIRRRCRREPVAYIVAEQEFWSLPFQVNSSVLIPRPETEFLLETVLAKVAATSQPQRRCLDLCCGSGVIAAVLARELGAPVTAVDLSPAALRLARKNCRRHDVGALVSFLCADLFEALSPESAFPLIVTNPPYVARAEIKSLLQPEVAGYEPHLALDGGGDGLALIRRIADRALAYLAPGGMLFMEFGCSQGAAVAALFTAASRQGRFFQDIEIVKDYSGRDRVLYGRANFYRE